MLTTLEQAISALHISKQPITVRNAIAAYFNVAGFNGSDVCVEDAVVAFEHALDKHPLPPACASLACRRQFVPEVDRLRKEYWTERSGCFHCVCGKCGCPVVPKELAARTEELTQGRIPPAKRPAARKRTFGLCLSFFAPTVTFVRIAGNVKKRKTPRPCVSNSSDSESSPSSDPYGPSTSAVVL